MSKAVIFFAPGLEECEGLLCVDLLRRSGVEVTIAAVGGEKIVKSARSISVVADALAEELDYSAFDAAILPGGIPGVDNLKADATVRKVCTEFAAAGKVVAAICAAPSVLAAFGILQGNAKTDWVRIVFVGIGYFIVYYFLFSFLIRRFDFKTPGRESGADEVKLYTRADVNARKQAEADGTSVHLSGNGKGTVRESAAQDSGWRFRSLAVSGVVCGCGWEKT